MDEAAVRVERSRRSLASTLSRADPIPEKRDAIVLARAAGRGAEFQSGLPGKLSSESSPSLAAIVRAIRQKVYGTNAAGRSRLLSGRSISRQAPERVASCFAALFIRKVYAFSSPATRGSAE